MPIRIPMGGGGGRGMSLSTIVILVIGFFVLRAIGIDPLQFIEGGPAPQQVGTQPQGTGSDEGRQFVAVVLAETEDVWHALFEGGGATYEEPGLTLFDGGVNSACGFASVAAGPFYCPGDRKVYIDLEFFDTLERQFDAAGDFARAYVIAHEVGHHVQNLTGVLPEFNRLRSRMSEAEANAMSIRVELQADCYAGLWAHHTERRGLLEEGDLEEALNAAFQIGDDTLQKRTQGYVVPESFNHGTSEQRRRWFLAGFRSGEVAACDTFSGNI
jgi:predicted metalloprotease